MRRDEFRRVCQLKQVGAAPSSPVSPLNRAVGNVFTLLGVSTDAAAVDVRDVFAALYTLASGDEEEKLRAAFGLYDSDGDGALAFQELSALLRALYAVLLGQRGDAPAQTLGQSRSLATSAAFQVFQQVRAHLDLICTCTSVYMPLCA